MRGQCGHILWLLVLLIITIRGSDSEACGPVCKYQQPLNAADEGSYLDSYVECVKCMLLELEASVATTPQGKAFELFVFVASHILALKLR
jgi:hypothetical protein